MKKGNTKKSTSSVELGEVKAVDARIIEENRIRFERVLGEIRLSSRSHALYVGFFSITLKKEDKAPAPEVELSGLKR